MLKVLGWATTIFAGICTGGLLGSTAMAGNAVVTLISTSANENTLKITVNLVC